MSLYESCSWPEAGLLRPALLSSLKSVQAPAVGPGIPRQGQGRARVRPEGRVRTAQRGFSLLESWRGGRAAPGSLVPPWKERGHICTWRSEWGQGWPDTPAS